MEIHFVFYTENGELQFLKSFLSYFQEFSG
jgi:hypothetical protein